MLYKRISSGLDFLDASIGGLYAGRTYLLRGPSQSGRTTIAFQFALSGIADGENVLMLCSEKIENVILKAETNGIHISDYLMDNRLILMEYPRDIITRQGSYTTIVKLLGEIEEYIGYYRCSRLIFDTLIPLLSQTSEPHLINYIYSLMSSIDAFDTSTLLIIGEPGSPMTFRITQLLEDAVVGSFSLVKNKTKEGQRMSLLINKFVNQILPPTNFNIRFEYGVGIVQDIEVEPILAPSRELDLSELPLFIALIDEDKDTVVELEDIFHPDSIINHYETEAEALMNLKTIDCDLLIVNISQSKINYKRFLVTIREQYPKLPIFLIANDRKTGITYQQIKQSGGDGLFFKPLIAKDLLGALKKSLIQYDKYDEIVAKRSYGLSPEHLPEDIESLNERSKGYPSSDTAIGLLSVPDFKELIERQIFKSDREDSTFALVSFKMVYMGDSIGLPHLPQGLELVKQVGEVVVGSLRGINDRACRYMDKIVILLENTDINGARAFMGRVLGELRSSLFRRLNLQVGRSINVLSAMSIYPRDAGDAVELLHSVTEVSKNFVKTIS